MTLRWVFFPGGSPCFGVLAGAVLTIKGKGAISIVARGELVQCSKLAAMSKTPLDASVPT
jgi:hypothetical protein